MADSRGPHRRYARLASNNQPRPGRLSLRDIVPSTPRSIPTIDRPGMTVPEHYFGEEDEEGETLVPPIMEERGWDKTKKPLDAFHDMLRSAFTVGQNEGQNEHGDDREVERNNEDVIRNEDRQESVQAEEASEGIGGEEDKTDDDEESEQNNDDENEEQNNEDENEEQSMQQGFEHDEGNIEDEDSWNGISDNETIASVTDAPDTSATNDTATPVRALSSRYQKPTETWKTITYEVIVGLTSVANPTITWEPIKQEMLRRCPYYNRTKKLRKLAAVSARVPLSRDKLHPDLYVDDTPGQLLSWGVLSRRDASQAPEIPPSGRANEVSMQTWSGDEEADTERDTASNVQDSDERMPDSDDHVLHDDTEENQEAELSSLLTRFRPKDQSTPQKVGARGGSKISWQASRALSGDDDGMDLAGNSEGQSLAVHSQQVHILRNRNQLPKISIPSRRTGWRTPSPDRIPYVVRTPESAVSPITQHDDDEDHEVTVRDGQAEHIDHSEHEDSEPEMSISDGGSSENVSEGGDSQRGDDDGEGHDDDEQDVMMQDQPDDHDGEERERPGGEGGTLRRTFGNMVWGIWRDWM